MYGRGGCALAAAAAAVAADIAAAAAAAAAAEGTCGDVDRVDEDGDFGSTVGTVGDWTAGTPFFVDTLPSEVVVATAVVGASFAACLLSTAGEVDARFGWLERCLDRSVTISLTNSRR